MLVEEVEGVKAGCSGIIMGVRDKMVIVGCVSSGRLQLLMAYTWELMPEAMLRRAQKRGLI